MVGGERFVGVPPCPVEQQSAQVLVRELVAHEARAVHVDRGDDVVLHVGLKEHVAFLHDLGLVREVQEHERADEVPDDRGNAATAPLPWRTPNGTARMVPSAWRQSWPE